MIKTGLRGRSFKGILSLGALGFCFFLAPTARALVVGEGQDDHSMMHFEKAPMLESVGQLGKRRSGSAVYLGKGWILTANHAFEGRHSEVVVFAGQEFKMKSRRAVRLKNPSGTGKSSLTDLVMVPLEASPKLPELKIAIDSPFSGEKVVMIGCGVTEEAAPLTGSPTEAPSVKPISGGNDVPGTPRWGENTVADRGLQVGIANEDGVTQAYATICQPGSTSENAQGASGDSGGGVFIKRGDEWRLSGIMLSVLHREDLNASGTFMADLSVYRKQIEATIPEPSVAMMLMAAAFAVAGRRRR